MDLQLVQKAKTYTKSEDFKLSVKKSENKVKNFFLNLVIIIILIGTSFVILSPIIGLVSDSFMPLEDFYNPLIYLIPENPNAQNLITAFKQIDYPKSLAISLGFSVVIMLLQAFICSFVGYGFARFDFPGNKILFALVVLTIVVPVQTIMVPLYTQFRGFDIFGIISLISGKPLNLINTPYPLLLMTITGMGLRSGLFIYIFRQFFKGLPKELESAAFIDGAGTFYTYFFIMLPNAIPSIITVMLFALVWQYNDVFFSSLFMENMGFLSVKLTTLASKLSAQLQIRDPNQVKLIISSGVLLTILPLVVIYLFLQKYFMEGIERSGIVG
ncbi:MAG: transporter periplasmic subunit-2 [Oscillospiraceae bacterium]|nr:transporter periplasmic subunit-2 [Oscillospiraceae bacterium]